MSYSRVANTVTMVIVVLHVRLAIKYNSLTLSNSEYNVSEWIHSVTRIDVTAVHTTQSTAAHHASPAFVLKHFPQKSSYLLLIKKLFRQKTSNRHCLHLLLPKLKHTKALNSLRSRGHNYQLPQIEFDLFKNSFLDRCLFLHLN